MSYRENEVVAKYTKGNKLSDCGKYSVNDLLEMFDEAEITVDEYGTTDGVTVNDLVTFGTTDCNLVVTSECDDMFCYYNKENTVNVNDIPCSAELDYEFYYQSI